MMALVDTVRKMEMDAITMPCLLVYDKKDRIVNAGVTQKRFREIPPLQKASVIFSDHEDPNGHILGGDVFSPQSTWALTGVIHNFLKRIL